MERRITYLNAALVYMLVFTSGSLRYNQSDDKYLVLGTLVALLAWLIYTNRKISSSFLLYCIAFAGIMFSLSLYTDGSTSLASVSSMTMKLILAYLVIRTVGEKFTVTYVHVIVFLATISLFGYLSDSFQLFTGLVNKLPGVADRGHGGIFYVFRDIHHMSRNQSIFFEPGAYQAFLNAALFILFFTKTCIDGKRLWVYIAILVAALITAFSTTGFIIFLCGISLFFYKSEITSLNGKIVLIVFGLLIISLFAAQFHSAFIKKINDYVSANEYEFTYSAQTRSSQLKADLKVIKNNLFGLGQKKYLEEFKLVGRTDNRGSSNGVTRIVAVYGLPISLFLYASYFLAIRRMLPDPALSTGAFIMFLLFLAGESYYISTPISYALIAGAFVFSQETAHAEYFSESAM